MPGGHDISEGTLTLEEIDVDGAIQEGLVGVYGRTRAEFLRKVSLGGATLVATLAIPAVAEAGKKKDTDYLNFDLVFEYLQAAFYTEAEEIGTVARMSPSRANWARTLGAHERAHVHILKQVLGSAAAAKPAFNFRGVTDSEQEFIKTAVAMEDLTVALLLGQTNHLANRKLVAALLSLLTVEARHAAWARYLVGTVPVQHSLDGPLTTRTVGRVVAKTRFIARRPGVKAKRKPKFTG